MQRKVYVYDLECFLNFHCATFMELETKQIKQFVIHKSRNNFSEYIKFLQEEVSGLIGFNNLDYDYPILHYLLTLKEQLFATIELPEVRLTRQIYNKSNEVINTKWSSIPEWKTIIPQLDLYKIWHFDNQAKKTSLKAVEIAMDFYNVEDLPFEPNYIVEDNEVQQILDYNLNDVEATYQFYQITIGNTENPLYKGKDKLQLRKDIQKEFGIKCCNYNDVKIGDELNKLNYSKNSGLSWNKIKDLPKQVNNIIFGQCIPDYIKFKTQELNNFYNLIKDESLIQDTDRKKQIFKLDFKGTIYTIARGGIHSNDKPRKLIPTEDQILRDADVGSQYPNAIVKRNLYPRHLGEAWIQGYKDNIEKRLYHKSLYKKTKDAKHNSIQEVFKLALNGGGFGKTNEPTSWQYDPLVQFSCTIGNQFEILMLIEEMELNNIHVVSANTDGIVCLFDKSLNDKYYEICHNWEKIVGNDKSGQLEYKDYKFLIQTSVNDYIALDTKGEIKKKGDFETEFELHKNNSMRIVRYALEQYFINNIPIEQTILNHTNIFHFCKRVKIVKGWWLEERYIDFNSNEAKSNKLSKNVRFYISNDGKTFIKCHEDSREISVEKGWLATKFNKFIDKPIKEYNINYDYYINECNKIIKKIEKS